jgi:hypothetical protein
MLNKYLTIKTDANIDTKFNEFCCLHIIVKPANACNGRWGHTPTKEEDKEH